MWQKINVMFHGCRFKHTQYFRCPVLKYMINIRTFARLTDSWRNVLTWTACSWLYQPGWLVNSWQCFKGSQRCYLPPSSGFTCATLLSVDLADRRWQVVLVYCANGQTFKVCNIFSRLLFHMEILGLEKVTFIQFICNKIAVIWEKFCSVAFGLCCCNIISFNIKHDRNVDDHSHRVLHPRWL